MKILKGIIGVSVRDGWRIYKKYTNRREFTLEFKKLSKEKRNRLSPRSFGGLNSKFPYAIFIKEIR